MTISDKKHNLKASTLRIILAVSLFAVVAGTGGGFYLVYSLLHDKAKDVSDTQTEAMSSDVKLQSLISLRDQLDTHETTVDKVQQIVAESQSYQYQNQIINDLTNYANQSGVEIMSFTFKGEEVAATPPPAAPAATEGAPATEGEATAETQAPAAPATKSTQVSIQLGEETAYSNLLEFMHLIEQNLTRMQIMELYLTRGENADTVTAQALNLEVYIK